MEGATAQLSRTSGCPGPAPPCQALSSAAPPARRGLSPASPRPLPRLRLPPTCGDNRTCAKRVRMGSSRAPHTQGSQRRTDTALGLSPAQPATSPAARWPSQTLDPPSPSSPAVLSSDLDSSAALRPVTSHPPTQATLAGKDARTPQGPPSPGPTSPQDDANAQERSEDQAPSSHQEGVQGHEGGGRPWGKAETRTHRSAAATRSLGGASALGSKRLCSAAGHSPRRPLPGRGQL